MKSVIHFVDLTFLTPVERLNLLLEKVHGLAVPTSGSSTKKILAENLGQVVQDVKFEFSRTEKSTWVRWQKLANLKYWYKIIFY